MKQTPIRLGPLALLLTVLCICLAVLAVLSLSTAGADLRMAERHAGTVQTRYALEQAGQEYLRALSEQGQDDLSVPDADGVLWRTFAQKDGMELTVGVRLEDGRCRVVAWTVQTVWQQPEVIGDLWTGN